MDSGANNLPDLAQRPIRVEALHLDPSFSHKPGRKKWPSFKRVAMRVDAVKQVLCNLRVRKAQRDMNIAMTYHMVIDLFCAT